MEASDEGLFSAEASCEACVSVGSCVVVTVDGFSASVSFSAIGSFPFVSGIGVVTLLGTELSSSPTANSGSNSEG